MSVVTESRDELQARWAKLDMHERQMVVIIVCALVFLVVWLAFVRPAWNTLAAAPALREQADAQLLQMQAIAGEASQLRALPPVPLSMAQQALQTATEALGAKGKLSIQNDRAVLSLTGARGEALRTWLIQARAGARARPIEATLTRAGAGYNGTLVVAIGSPQ